MSRIKAPRSGISPTPKLFSECRNSRRRVYLSPTSPTVSGIFLTIGK